MSNPLGIDEIGRALPSNYALQGFIDQGGEGAVFKGKVGSQLVAIKIFNPQGDARRISRELSLLQTISCDHLVSIVDTTQIELRGVEVTVVAYDYLSGGDLRRLIGSQPSEDLLAKIGLDVSEAVELLWKNRIVHRDIKPHNIMRSKDTDDDFVLADVGFARHLDRSDITRVGLAAGTPGYMSPEQAQGRRSLTIRSDVFSLGITLYLLATNTHPFNGQQHLIGVTSPAPLTNRRADLSTKFCRLIHDMMSVRAADRPTHIMDRFKELYGE